MYSGVLTKMSSVFGEPIIYSLTLNGVEINLNDLLGEKIGLKFDGYQCLNCGKERKIYRQGFCYNCFFESPLRGEWIIRPELSKAHLNIEDRDLEYEKEVQLKPHIVYLALSSGVKVGVTRKTQVPTRWIDQGASFAIRILETPNRYLAGIAEAALKKKLADKTNWRKMLKNEIGEENLFDIKNEIRRFVPDEAKKYFLENDDRLFEMKYPVIRHPEKVKSLKLEKYPEFESRLLGIKGQYLIFEEGYVFNVRNHEGYKIRFLAGGDS